MKIKRFIKATAIGILTFFELTLTGQPVWAWRIARRSEYGHGGARRGLTYGVDAG